MSNDRTSSQLTDASSPKKRRWGRFGLGALVLLFFVFLGRHQLGELHRLKDVSQPIVLLMLICVGVARVAQARTVQILLAAQKYFVQFRVIFHLTNVAGYSNLLVPRAGVGTSAIYLNRVHQVPLTSYGSLSVFLTLIDAVATGILGLASMLLAHSAYSTYRAIFDPTIALLFGLVAVAGIAAASLRVDLDARPDNRLTSSLRSLGTAWSELSNDRSRAALVLTIRLALLLLSAFRLQLAFSALDVDLSFFAVLLAAMLGTLAQISSITPAGIGVREAAIAYAATVIGCSPATALAAAILDRIVTTIFLVLAGQISLWRFAFDRDDIEKRKNRAK